MKNNGTNSENSLAVFIIWMFTMCMLVFGTYKFFTTHVDDGGDSVQNTTDSITLDTACNHYKKLDSIHISNDSTHKKHDSVLPVTFHPDTSRPPKK